MLYDFRGLIWECCGPLFGHLGVENWTAWQELRFGIFRFSLAPLVPELRRREFCREFYRFFYRLSAINGLKFIVIGDKSKNDKNATLSRQ